MLDRNEVYSKIIEAIENSLIVENVELSEETHLVNDLDADSIDFATLFMELEEVSDKKIPDDIDISMKDITIGDLVDLVIELESKA